MTPSDLMHAFAAALGTGDRAQLEALCTAKGISGRGESVGRFIRQHQRSALEWIPLAEIVEANQRAAVCGLLSEPGRGRGLGKLWLTALKRDRWQLEGYTKDERCAALFVSGVLPAIFQASELPTSDLATRWAHSVLEDHREGTLSDPCILEGLERLAHDRVGSLDVVGSRQIAAIGRHVAGIGRRHGVDDVRQTTWFALQKDAQGGFRLVSHHNGCAQALLFSEPTG